MDYYANVSSVVDKLTKKRASHLALTSRKLSKSAMKTHRPQPYTTTLTDINESLHNTISKLSQPQSNLIPLPNLADTVQAFHITDLHWANSKVKSAIVTHLPALL
jgi:hypothetical protein